MAAICIDCVQTTPWKSLVDGRLARLSEKATLREVFAAEVEPRLLPSRGGTSATSQSQLTVCASLGGAVGSWKDVDLDDTVGLIADFGCKYVRFQVATEEASAEPSAKKVCQRSAYDVLLAAADRRDCLPPKRKDGNAKDRLLNDVLHHLEQHGMGFSPDVVDGEGSYVVQTIVNALWYVDPHWSTIVQECSARPGLSAVPVRWRQVFSVTTYNDWQAKKQKRPRLDRSALGAHARALLSLVAKPILAGNDWRAMRDDVEGLATAMMGYCEYLEAACEKQKERQSRPQPVRQISTNVSVTCLAPVQLSELSPAERKLNDWMVLEDAYTPVFYDEETIFDKALTKDQRYKFLKALKISRPLDVLRYDPGGGSSAVVVLWWVPDKETESNHATHIARLVKLLESQLPVFHTRQMRRDFYAQYGRLSGMSPAVMRAVYFDLTGDATASTGCSPDVDQRMRLYILGELPEIITDLRHMNSGRPQAYDQFFDVASHVLQDWLAEDDRRHGAMHLSKFISIPDFHRQVVCECPPGTKIPSQEWLRLQFLPVDPDAASAVHYTGKLEVKFAVQSRVLRAKHEDDHYAAAVFKYQRAMAVDLRNTQPVFVCMDDKAKIPIGEPGRPTSTNVRSRPSLVAKGHPLTAMDHDHSKASLTPSVILRSTVPTDSNGSFYRGQADVRLKDSVFEQSGPFRHMAELSASARQEPDQECPPVLFAYTDGGADHRLTCKSVQLAYIALFIHEDLDLLVAGRTCPGHSFANPAERVMSTLNLGLQNAAFARARMPDEREASIKQANSMAAIRTVASRCHGIQEAWLECIQPVKDVIMSRFSRLVYGGDQVRVLDTVSSASMSQVVKDLWPDIDLQKLTAKDMANKEGFQQFLKTHCRARQYSFQIRKCGEIPCQAGVCKKPRSDLQNLYWLPDPQPDPTNPGHFLPFAKLKGDDTQELHCPSLQRKADEQGSKIPAGMVVGQKLRSTVRCGECSKPRGIYSNKVLTTTEQQQLAVLLEQVEYTCGSPLTTEGSDLHGQVFVQLSLRCHDHVEFAYFACPRKKPDVCCHCGGLDAMRDPVLLRKYKVVLPVCEACKDCRPAITRNPKSSKK